MKCRACGRPALHPYGEKNGIPLWGCDCGSLNAEVLATTLPRYSEAYVGASFEAPVAVRRSLAATVERVEGFRQLGRWADLGFGEAALLREVERLGWQCAGVEVARASLEFGRARGWDVRDSSAAWAAESFDVVSIVEVLEHVLEPDALLREASRLLRPGGALIATTPNIGSINFRILGPRWTVVAPPEHITLFSADGLRRLVREIPLDVLDLQTSGLNPMQLLRGGQGQITAAERNAGGQRLVEVSARPGGRVLKSLANAVLGLLRAGDTLKLLATKPQPNQAAPQPR